MQHEPLRVQTYALSVQSAEDELLHVKSILIILLLVLFVARGGGLLALLAGLDTVGLLAIGHLLVGLLLGLGGGDELAESGGLLGLLGLGGIAGTTVGLVVLVLIILLVIVRVAAHHGLQVLVVELLIEVRVS